MLEDKDFFLPIFGPEANKWTTNNNFSYEKQMLIRDFLLVVSKYINDTFMGDDFELNITDIKKHFEWSLNKTIDDFEKENIFFKRDGSHKTYLYLFFYLTYYVSTDALKYEKLVNYIYYSFEEIDDITFILLYNILNENLTNGNT